MRKQLIAAGIAAAVGVTGIAGLNVANAATDTTNPGPMSGLVEAVASKFNLNKAEVQSVFDAQRTQMQTEREAEAKKEIAQLVTDGKLTQAQADKLNAKRAEMQTEREAHRAENVSKTREERKAEMQEHRTELEAWAKENGIDTTYLSYVMGGGHGQGGPGRNMH